MTLDKRKEHFLLRATELYGNKFDYSLMSYTKQKDKITIICPVHGQFQQTPDKHLAKNAKGCPQCWESVKGEFIKRGVKKRKEMGIFKGKPSTSKEDFLIKANFKFNNKYQYDLSSYNAIGGNKILIICPIHGSHGNMPHNHLQSWTGCPECGRISRNQSKTRDYETIVFQLQNKHAFYYDYPDYNKETYKNKRSKIDIICKKHGIFTKSAQKHLSGQGCWPCKIEELIEKNILVGGYSEELFKQKPELKDKKAELYYLKVNNGQYYKIGISCVSSENRVKSLISKAKKSGELIDIEILNIKEASLYEVFRLEQKIIEQNKNSRIYTKWSTELFNKNIWDDISTYFTSP